MRASAHRRQTVDVSHERPCLTVRRNRSFGSALPETKWAYIEKRSAGILRKVAKFAQDAYNSPSGLANFIKNEMKSWG